MKRAARALRGGAAAARPLPEPAALTPKDIRAYTQEPLADRWGVPADRRVFFLASRLEDQLGARRPRVACRRMASTHAWPLLDGYRQARKLAGGKAQGGVRRYRHPCPRESGHRPPFPGRGRRLAAGLGVPAPALHDSGEARGRFAAWLLEPVPATRASARARDRRAYSRSHEQPHGQDPQVAPARQEVLTSPGRAKTRGRRFRGVDWLDWPCGQNLVGSPKAANAVRRTRR